MVLDLTCDGVKEADIDWRLSEILEESASEVNGFLRLQLTDDHSLYVSEIVCTQARIDVVTELETSTLPLNYVLAGRRLDGNFVVLDEVSKTEVVLHVPYGDRPQRGISFSDVYFDQGTS